MNIMSECQHKNCWLMQEECLSNEFNQVKHSAALGPGHYYSPSGDACQWPSTLCSWQCSTLHFQSVNRCEQVGMTSEQHEKPSGSATIAPSSSALCANIGPWMMSPMALERTISFVWSCSASWKKRLDLLAWRNQSRFQAQGLLRQKTWEIGTSHAS